MKQPAQTKLSATAALASAFAGAGYQVEILVTRTNKMDLPGDANATPALLDAPFEEQECRNLAGLFAAYEADRSEG